MLLVEFYSTPQQGGSTFCTCAWPVTWQAPPPFVWHLKEPSFTQETWSAGQFSRRPSTPQPLQEAWHRPWKEHQCQQLTSKIHRFVFLYSRPSSSSDVAVSSLFPHYRILTLLNEPLPEQGRTSKFALRGAREILRPACLNCPGASGNLSSLTQSYTIPTAGEEMRLHAGYLISKAVSPQRGLWVILSVRNLKWKCGRVTKFRKRDHTRFTTDALLGLLTALEERPLQKLSYVHKAGWKEFSEIIFFPLNNY